MKIFRAIVNANPWGLIAWIFALQAVGAVVLAGQFHIALHEIAWPVSLLVVGACVSLFLRWHDASPEVRSWKWWFPAVFYGVFIFLMSNRDYPDAVIPFNVKIFHVLEYMTLGVYLGWAWHDVVDRRGILLFLLRVLPACAIFAMSDEFHQTFITGRTGRSMDVIIDLVGAAAGCGLVIMYRRLRGFSQESAVFT